MEIFMNEPVKAWDWNLVQKLAEFVKVIIAGNKQTHDVNTPVEGDTDVVFSPVDTAEEIKQFYPAIEKAFPLENVAGENQGKLWIEGSFYEGEERQSKRLAIGTWLSCRIGNTTVPVWVGISDTHPALFACCLRKSVFGIEGPKNNIGRWQYDSFDDAYWTPLSENEIRERDSFKGFKKKMRELCDKIQREWKQNPEENSDDAPIRQKM
jgi:hypothetical protein